MKKLQAFLAHCNVVFGLVFIVLIVLNKFISGMQFLSSAVTRWFLLIFCLCAIALGVVTVVLYRRARRSRLARARMQRMQQDRCPPRTR